MTTYGTIGSSSSLLTAEERAIAEYFADAECERKRPRNYPAYRATVLARKASELLYARQVRAEGATVLSAPRVLEEEPAAPPVPIDPLLAREARRLGLELGRRERAELLAKMESEQNRDPRW